MTSRKPEGLSWERWVDRLLREARGRGEFDDLSGRGKPLPGIEGPRDDLWWVKDKLRRENVSIVPPTLKIRREIEEARERIAEADSASEVRRILAAINARIRHLNAHATAGPPSNVVPLNVEHEVVRWRQQQRDDVTS